MTPPAEFDWVTARSACSPPKIFQQLKLEIEGDIRTRNDELRTDSSPHWFSMTASGNAFTVLLNKVGDLSTSGEAITFRATAKGIAVSDHNDTLLFEATLTLNAQGECRLKIKGQEREFWQVRWMALEQLFFETV